MKRISDKKWSYLANGVVAVLAGVLIAHFENRCSSRNEQKAFEQETKGQCENVECLSLKDPMKYAHNMRMEMEEDGLSVTIRNPWDTTRVLHRYLLTTDSTLRRPDATVVKVPLRNAAVFTSVQCALMMELNCPDIIGGVCEIEYIHVPYVQKGVSEGRIADLGNGMSPNIERMMDLQPDAILTTPFENSGGYGRLERIGIPIIECADYMESSPLARAEWVRFYGRLFGREKEADSLFKAVETAYLAIKKRIATETERRPRLLVETPQGSHWYVPGGASTMGQLYQDAGADYIFSSTSGAGSTPLSIEQVLERGMDAQVWILKHHGPVDLRQLRKDYPALARINAPMYLCDTSTSLFYEETPYHPERLLQNLVNIFHPELAYPEEYSYFCPLE
ncbi:MAG: ABC transporter substrate-binding protein [Bacteroidaceae bacterium]|nr:ABC transporter substrate-binding protein [Bacteroidaceae bacterium]